MTQRKIPPATKQARAYSPDDPRYERNARLKALEDQRAATPTTIIQQVPGSGDVTIFEEGEVDVYVDSVLVGTRGGLNLIPGTNMALLGVDSPSQDRVNVTFNASGGGAGAWDFDEGDASIVYVLGDFDFDGGGA